MQSPIASFFAPALPASGLHSQKTGSVMPGIPQFGSAGVAEIGAEGESFFDLLMMAGIEKNSSAASMLDATETNQLETSATTSDPTFLKSGLSLSVLNETQIGQTVQFQLMTDLLSNAHISMPLSLVTFPSEITQEGKSQTALSGHRVNSLLQSSALQVGSSIDQIGKGEVTLDTITQFDTSLSTVAKPSTSGTRELSRNSFLFVETMPTVATPYSLKVDPQLTLSAGPQGSNPHTTLAQQTEHLLGITNTSSVQLIQDTQVQNQTSGQLSSSEMNVVTPTAAGQANPFTGTVVPVAQKNGLNKTTVQQDQTAGVDQSTTALNIPNTLSQESETATGDNLTGKKKNSSDNSSELLDAGESQENFKSSLQDKVSTPDMKSDETGNIASYSNSQLQSDLQTRSNDGETSTKADQVRFILPNLTHASTKNGTSIVIDLEPRSLGAAELRLTVRNEVVHAELRVNSQEAKQTVEANLDQLQKSFDRAGITVSKVDVSLNNQGDARQFTQQHGWHAPKFKINQHRFTLDESLDGAPSIAAQPLFSASTLIRPQPGRSWTA